MRVIAGSRRSLPLRTIEGKDTRPTTDRIKETLFNMLQPEISSCRFLDVFAGSGGIGIEALSRGASFACFVENSRKALNVIEANIAFTKFKENAKVINSDATRVFSMKNSTEPFDIVFMDPPYALGCEKMILEQLLQNNGWTKPETLYIIEASILTDFSWVADLGCTIVRNKEYKTNKHVFIKSDRA